MTSLTAVRDTKVAEAFENWAEHFQRSRQVNALLQQRDSIAAAVSEAKAQVGTVFAQDINLLALICYNGRAGRVWRQLSCKQSPRLFPCTVKSASGAAQGGALVRVRSEK